ncbi:putative transmembrane protein [Gregarina niphandrodes]|uniref:Transmembrane protein n=1 Tax=Gregarina niphandrodes TaxID=110365 RepID=A0A023BA59_GRENI|nr:putative transmembrane protein [Gregarina niphandrodes]EZG77896.1 putative transmembrane protein [Gregarina niphandrodes]|eukprot:XP_011129473.1 putative transmembrane protein [Gregarina niphandrodes]
MRLGKLFVQIIVLIVVLIVVLIIVSVTPSSKVESYSFLNRYKLLQEQLILREISTENTIKNTIENTIKNTIENTIKNTIENTITEACSGHGKNVDNYCNSGTFKKKSTHGSLDDCYTPIIGDCCDQYLNISLTSRSLSVVVTYGGVHIVAAPIILAMLVEPRLGT